MVKGKNDSSSGSRSAAETSIEIPSSQSGDGSDHGRRKGSGSGSGSGSSSSSRGGGGEGSGSSLGFKNRPASGLVWLQWKDVTYVIPSSEKGTPDKTILHGISGEAKPGQIIAIMGPTGCGKTTLCNVLQGRASLGQVTEGSVMVNNTPVTKQLKRVTGYVQQEDVFFEGQTVREALMFSATLRLPSSYSHADKVAAVDSVIEDLNLESCANTKIMQISGGEKKRTSIGEQLLCEPSLMVLDEPTSGLDSFTARNVVAILKKVAKARGLTVLVTIHQPSWQIFEMFDRLLLLADGHTVFTGTIPEVVPYFEALGHSNPPGNNPADFILELVTSEENATVKSSLIEAWAARPPLTLSKCTLDKGLEERTHKFASTWFQQFVTCGLRAFQKSRQSFTGLQVFQMAALTAIISAVWWQIPYEVAYIDEFEGMLFFNCTIWAFFAIFPAIVGFPLERPVMNKERAQGTYRLSAYFLGKAIFEIPVLLIQPVFCTCIAYFAVNLRYNAEAFFGHLFIIMISVISASGMGISMGTIFKDLEQAMVGTSILALGMYLIAGFFVDSNNLPKGLRWIDNLSVFKHIYDGIYIVQFNSNDTYECSEGVYNFPAEACPVTGRQIMEVSGKPADYGLSVLAIVVMYVIFLWSAYLGLKYRNQPKR